MCEETRTAHTLMEGCRDDRSQQHLSENIHAPKKGGQLDLRFCHRAFLIRLRYAYSHSSLKTRSSDQSYAAILVGRNIIYSVSCGAKIKPFIYDLISKLTISTCNPQKYCEISLLVSIASDSLEDLFFSSCEE